MSDDITLRALQERIRSIDHRPDFKPAYFHKLIEEVGELAEVLWTNARMQGNEIKGTIEEELVDVLYYVVALANVYDIDLATCFDLKDAVNAVKYGRAVPAK